MNRTQKEETNLINKLATYCKGKLHVNRYKEHWNNSTILELFRRHKEEDVEFLDAINRKLTPEEVWKEAGDAANFLAFAADNYEKQYRK